jgi:hypothetical protein
MQLIWISISIFGICVAVVQMLVELADGVAVGVKGR